MREKVRIPAMRKRDMQAFFEQHGLSVAIERGELECTSCGISLDWNTIAGFVMHNGKPLPFCSSPACVEHMHDGDIHGQAS